MNNQAISELFRPADGDLEVQMVWGSIQGEGPYVGTPAAFIRLHGCNLRCPACDTDYTSSKTVMNVEQVIREVQKCSYPLVVLTGGEPFRQNIEPLCRRLLRLGKRVQIETNGTLYLPAFPYLAVTVVCSPKTTIAPEIVPYVKAWKYVVQDGYIDDDGLPSRTLGGYRPARPPLRKCGMEDSCGCGGRCHADPSEVFVQPLDEGNVEANHKNLQAAIKSCLLHGYRLGIQLHKLIGVL